MTALLEGLINGHSKIVQLLLDYHADPNISAKVNHSTISLTDKSTFIQDGNTALHFACKEGDVNVIQSLLSQGADTTIKNIDGNTPLDECYDTSKDEVANLFTQYNPKRGIVLNSNYIKIILT